MVVATLLVLLLSGFTSAAMSAEEWQPVAPLPEKDDWIQLKSGEWLKGEFIALYKDTLEFDSKELDLLSLDWEDVKQVRTARIMDIGLLGRVKATGKVWLEGDTIRIVSDDNVVEFKRSQIVSITTGAESELKKWSGKFDFGLTLQKGNVNQYDFTTGATVLRRTIENRLSFKYLANFSSVNSNDTIDNQRATVTWDKFVTDRFYASPVVLDWYRDPFQNIASRTTLAVGVGYVLIDTKKTEWAISGGPGYQQTDFDSVQEGENDRTSTGALTLETNFDQDWTKAIEFKFQYRGQITNTASGKYNHHMVATLETEWTKILDFDFSFIWDRTEEPQPEADGTVPEQNDFRLVVSLGIEF
jgi:putative salt-induced outer membrane protein YdiY